jgi:glycosyltransferase involved in cell wall biosynthesis
MNSSDSRPLVSVLVTVYNREYYLAECLDSILASTWTDFEVVVVDDCSTDASVAIAESFATRDTRIHIHRNSANLGDYRNRNRAAALARGKYLKYLDADDLIYPHSLEAYVVAMDRFPDAALGLSLNVIDPAKPFPFVTDSSAVIRSHFLGRSVLGVGPSAAMIRRDAFEAIGGFSGRQFIGDSELWLKLGERWPLVSLPPALVWWRQHEGQQMHLEVARPEVLNLRLELEEEALVNTKHLDSQEKANAFIRLRQHHARRLWSLAIFRRSPLAAWRLFGDSGLGCCQLFAGLRRYK